MKLLQNTYIDSDNKESNFNSVNLNLRIEANNNTVFMQDCLYKMQIKGSGNKVISVNDSISNNISSIEIQGNGNLIILTGTKVSITIKGNSNEIESQAQNITLGSLVGFGNIVPHKEPTYRHNTQSGQFLQPPIFQNKYPILQKNQLNIKKSQKMQNTSHSIKNIFQKKLNEVDNPNIETLQKEQPQKFYQIPRQPPKLAKFQKPQIKQQRTINKKFSMNLAKFNQQFPSNIIGFRQNRINHQVIRPPIHASQEEQTLLPLEQHQLKILSISKHVGKDYNCHICLEDIIIGHEETFLFCFHNFHTKCVLSWMRKSPTCPLCMMNVRKQINQFLNYR